MKPITIALFIIIVFSLKKSITSLFYSIKRKDTIAILFKSSMVLIILGISAGLIYLIKYSI